MAKKEPKEQIERYEKTYSNQELDLIKAEIELAGSEKRYLINKGAFVENEYGGVSVVQKLDGSIPYNELARALEALDKRESRIRYAENARIERETGKPVENPALNRLRESMRGLKMTA